MADAKQAWSDVADQLSGLGMKLKMHFEQAAQPETSETEESVKKAVDEVRDALDRAFSTMGNAVKDPAVKQDVADVARSLGDALATTFSEVSENLRSALGSKDRKTDDPRGS